MTKPLTGVMYDSAFVPLAAIIAAKPTVMSLYTDGTHAASQQTVDTLRAASIPIWWNHENAQTELAGGHAAGILAATHAMNAVISRGTPADGSCDLVFSVDLSVGGASFPTYRDAFDGINETLAGRFVTKIYGEGLLIDYMVDCDRVKIGNWLSGSSSFPGYNVTDINVAVWQQVGSDIAGTDRDVITHLENMGAWGLQPQRKVNAMPLFHVSDGKGTTYVTDGLIGARHLVGADAEAWAVNQVKLGNIVDGVSSVPPFPLDQLQELLTNPFAGAAGPEGPAGPAVSAADVAASLAIVAKP